MTLIALGCRREIAPPATAGSPLGDSLAAMVERFWVDEKLPGVAAGVWKDGQIVYRGGFGATATGAAGQPVGPTTIFHLASISKPFVATAIMQLVEAGKVALDSTVRAYLPYFAIKGPGAETITIRQVLTHTAGIGDVTDYRWRQPEYDAGALERYVRGLADSTLQSKPGERFAYSNIGFELLADVVAKASGLSFEDYLQQRILTPLGMTKSTFLMSDIDSTLMASGHTRDSTGPRPTGVYPYNRRHAGSSTLHSNVDDMLRWAAANIGCGSLGDVRILPPHAYDELWRPQRDILEALAERARRAGVAVPFDSLAIGLSWFLPVRQGRHLVFHSGDDTGFTSYLLMAPAERVAVVVLVNSDATDPGTLSTRLLDTALR